MDAAVCDLRGPDAQRAAREYERLHEGKKAPPLRCYVAPRPKGRLRLLGRITMIQYCKAIPGETPRYWHPFARHAQPRLYADRAGRVFVRGATYVTDTRNGLLGIKDMPKGRRTSKEISPSPTMLVDLGRLDWIRYASVRGRESVLRFGGTGAILAHDELGKLHVLGGNYHVRLQGESPMARRHRRRTNAAVRANPVANPSRKHRRGRKHARRANPAAARASKHSVPMQAAMLATQTAVLVGGAGIAGYGLDKIMSMPKVAAMSPWARAAISAGLGVAAGTGLLMALPDYRVVGAAAALAGVGEAGHLAYQEIQARRLAAQNSTHGLTLLPGGQAAGLPRGYVPMAAGHR